MHCSLAIVLIMAVMLTGCGSSPRSVEDIATEIRGCVPAGWHASASNNSIRISSDQQVALIGRMSRPAGMSIEELATKSLRTNYEMTLTFVPRLSTKEYLSLKARRAPFFYALDHAPSRVVYVQAMRGYETKRVPVFFTSDYSIFVDRPIDLFVQTYPSDVWVQAEAMLRRFKSFLKQYED